MNQNTGLQYYLQICNSLKSSVQAKNEKVKSQIPNFLQNIVLKLGFMIFLYMIVTHLRKVQVGFCQ